MSAFEYHGGRLWTIIDEPKAGGYPTTAVTVELERGKHPQLVCIERDLTRDEIKQLFDLIEKECAE